MHTGVDVGSQRTLHPPQLFGSLWVPTQRPAQHACPGPHGTAGHVVGAVHAPFTQLEPVGQRTLHPPQLFESVLVLTSHPFDTWPSQFEKPRLHAPMPHRLALHVEVPFGTGGQTLLQAPQLFGSEPVTAHAMPQHCAPGGHIMPPPQSGTHKPAEHALPPGHRRPHAPQFVASESRFDSHPFISMPSQSAKL
jgi:hypothetical protein